VQPISRISIWVDALEKWESVGHCACKGEHCLKFDVYYCLHKSLCSLLLCTLESVDTHECLLGKAKYCAEVVLN